MKSQEHIKRHIFYMRKGLDLDAKGLEIGPSYNPVCPKREHFNIKTLDVMSKNELIQHYSNNIHTKDFVDNIEDVDYIWTGGPYVNIVNEEQFDYIIAANVIEHQTDLLLFLRNIEDILSDSGILSLGVPDKRYSFDIFREVTSIRNVLDVHQLGLDVHPVGVHIDFLLHNAFYPGTGHAVPVDLYHNHHKIIFDRNFDSIRNFYLNYNDKLFIDQHAWIFTPTSLRLLLKELYALRLINLVEESFDVIPNSMEFYIKLRKDSSLPRTINRSEHLSLLMERQKEEYLLLNFASNLLLYLHDNSKSSGSLYIYGAGTIARYIIDILRENNVKIAGIIQSDNLEKSCVEGFATYHLSEISPSLNQNDLIIIGTSSEYQEDIITYLEYYSLYNYLTIYDILNYKQFSCSC